MKLEMIYFQRLLGPPTIALALGSLAVAACGKATPISEPTEQAPTAPTTATAPSTPEPTPLEAPMPIANPIVIDVHVDYVCPWCYIGTTRLDRAVAASGLADRVVIKRHPFLLDADIPPEGVDLAARLQKKYGRDPKQMFAQVEGVARQSGVPLDFAKQTRTYSTIAAHALMGYLIEIDASEKTQRAVEADLFTLHFVEGGNLSDTEALVRVAARHGVPEAPTRAALADKGRFDTVRRLAGEARGIGGVPYFKFENGETISGAQSEEVLAAAIKRAAAVTR